MHLAEHEGIVKQFFGVGNIRIISIEFNQKYIVPVFI